MSWCRRKIPQSDWPNGGRALSIHQQSRPGLGERNDAQGALGSCVTGCDAGRNREARPARPAAYLRQALPSRRWRTRPDPVLAWPRFHPDHRAAPWVQLIQSPTAASADQFQQGAGEQLRQPSAGPPPATIHVPPASGYPGSPGWRPLVFPFTSGEYPSRDAGDGGTRVCWEDVNLIPVVRDHEESSTRSTCRTQGCVSTCAIGVH